MTACSALALTAALTTLSSFLYLAAAFSNEFSPSPSRPSFMLANNRGGSHYSHDSNTRITAAAAAATIASSTALFYKDLEGTETSEDTKQQSEEIFVRSKRERKNKKLFKKQRASSYTTTTTTTTTASSSSSSTTTKKNKKKKLKNKQRSYNIHKRSKGVPVATREELATHVQSVFSDLKEYENSAVDGDVEDEFDNNSHSGGESTHDKGVMKQNSLLLDKHPALVLNADYQPLRMLPLSTWSWQTTVKAVLSGKAVVVDVYPDLYVRTVNFDVPVPSVIALREYAPTGKAVSV